MTPPKNSTAALSVVCLALSITAVIFSPAAAFAISTIGLVNLLAGCYLKNH